MKHKLQALFFLSISITGFSQSLDQFFGNGGKLVTHIGNDQDALTSLVLQSDGKIIGCGINKESDGIFHTAICRYNSNGTLDTSFGTNGKVVFQQIYHESDFSHVKLQNDGKIVIGTNIGTIQTDYDFLLVRLNTNGSYDASFGTNGVVITNFDSPGVNENKVQCMELQTDGKILLAGANSAYQTFPTRYEDFAIVRYNTDGSLDTSFAVNGKFELNIGDNSSGSNSIDGVKAIKLQSDGKIILGGYTDAQNLIEVYNLALVRLNTNGTVDTTFGTNGKTTTNFPASSAGINSLLINNDDTIIAASIINFNSNGNTKIGFLKYDANGSLFSGFGNNGQTTIQVNATAMLDTVWDMALQPDGKFIAVGYSLNTTIDYLLLRYNADGSIDNSFDSDGIMTTNFAGAADGAYAIIFQPDGKFLVGGVSGTAPDYEFALARYTLPDLNISNTTNADFTIYPNPATTFLNIQNPKNINIKNIVIMDLTGKRIVEQDEDVFQINIENLAKGIYFLEMDYDKGKQIEKFIKQ